MSASPASVRAAELRRRLPVAQSLVVLGLAVYAAATLDGFTTRASLYSTLVLAALLGLAAAGQTLVVLINGIDLSIAAFIVAGATVTVELTGPRGWPLPAALGVVAAGSFGMGALSGLLCHTFRVTSVIVTLGVGSVVVGAASVWTNGFVQVAPPAELQHFASPAGTTFGLDFPPVVAMWLLVAVVLGVVLARTTAGRRVYHTGANTHAAALALVPTRRVCMGVFGVSALLAAFTGVLLAGFAGAGEQSIGDPYLWQGITAVIVGGTSFGARGDYWRTVVGALFLTLLSSVLIGKGYGPADEQILFGLLILVAVAGHGRAARPRDRV